MFLHIPPLTHTSHTPHTSQALKNFLVLLFTNYASHRTLILQTLSLLDSTLPELHFVSMELLHKLLMRVTTFTHFKEEPQLRVKEGATLKKVLESVGLYARCVLFLSDA